MTEKKQVRLVVNSGFRDLSGGGAAAPHEAEEGEALALEAEALLERRGTGVIVQTLPGSSPEGRLTLRYDQAAGRLQVLRTGEAGLRMEFIRDRRSEAVFSTPAGKFALGVETKRLAEGDGEELELFLDYLTYAGEETVGSFSITIRAVTESAG